MASTAVGEMTVTVLQARGLGGLRTLVGKTAIYCILELDDIKCETPTEINTSPKWNKTYLFPVKDITSALDITVVDDTFITTTLGKISIPLLRINNNERRWYLLDLSYNTGDCPRIQLQMRVEWNVPEGELPGASVTLLVPGRSHIPRPAEHFIVFRNMFEWNSKKKSLAALAAWILSCYCFRVWMVPAAVNVLFFYYLIKGIIFGFPVIPREKSALDLRHVEDEEGLQNEEQFTDRLSRLKGLTIATQDGIDFCVMLIQKTKNLLMFHVPFLSFVAIVYLSVVTLVLYYIPINVLLMIFGVFKFSRRQYRTTSSSSSHIIDFLFRVPNDQELSTSFAYNGRCDAEKLTSGAKDSSY